MLASESMKLNALLLSWNHLQAFKCTTNLGFLSLEGWNAVMALLSHGQGGAQVVDRESDNANMQRQPPAARRKYQSQILLIICLNIPLIFTQIWTDIHRYTYISLVSIFMNLYKSEFCFEVTQPVSGCVLLLRKSCENGVISALQIHSYCSLGSLFNFPKEWLEEKLRVFGIRIRGDGAQNRI
jgi:hypothetical protein